MLVLGFDPGSQQKQQMLLTAEHLSSPQISVFKMKEVTKRF